MLNRISWSLLSSTDLPKEGIDLAYDLAVRANAAAKGLNYAILDTLARAQFLHGDKDQAVATQQAAIQAAKDDKSKAGLMKTLNSLKAGLLPSIVEE